VLLSACKTFYGEFMKLFASAVMAAAMLMTTFAFAQDDKKITDAKAAAGRWLELTDQGNYATSWDQGAAPFRAAVTRAGWEDALQAVRAPLGAVRTRTPNSAVFTRSLPGAPEGEYVVIQYVTEFEHKPNAVETVTPMREKDGSWKVSGYFIK
jgi:hypothetical protein